jgi:tetratricopeptide (TPR) repeat protein
MISYFYNTIRAGLCIIFIFTGFYTHITAQTAEQYLTFGKSKKEKGFYVESIQDFNKAIELNNEMEEAYYQRGEANFSAHRYQEAKHDFIKAIGLAPEQFMSQYYLGLTYNALEEYQLAKTYFAKCLESDRNHVNAYVGRAISHLHSNFPKQALMDCQKALELFPNHAMAISVRGLVSLKEGNEKLAIEDLKKAMQLDPNDPKLHVNIAQYYQQTLQTEKAIEAYSEAIKIDANHQEAFYNRAILKLDLNNYQEAFKDAQKVIYNNKRFFKAYIIRGIASFNMNDYPKFEYDFNIYFQNADSQEDHYFVAQKVYQYTHDKKILAEAEKWMAKVVQKESNFKNNLLYAEILFSLNKTTLALEIADNASTLAKKERVDATQSMQLARKIRKETEDQTPPVIRVITPIATTRGVIVVESSDKVTIIGEATDDSGIEKVLINGNPARLSADGKFDGIAVLQQGENTIKIEAYDKRGNMATKTIPVESKALIANNNGTDNQTPELQTGGKNRALFFATNDYDSWGDLINPIHDAKVIAKDMQDIYAFETVVLENLTKEEVILTIKKYAKLSYESNDQLFVFFAGHGQYDEILKEGYVVTKDSKFNDETNGSYIAHSNIRTYINSIPCKHIFLTMDVCFGGTFDPMLSRGQESNFSKNVMELINRKLTYTTRRYLTSGGKEYVPDGKPGQHSPFVRRFLEALRTEGGSDRILTIDEILIHVTGVNPTPHTGEFGNNQPGSDFLFIAK